MNATQYSTGGSDEVGLHEIRIQGHLDEQWTDWLEGLTFTHEPDGTTTLRGPLKDQAALHGVLNKIRDLAVQRLQPARARQRGGRRQHAGPHHLAAATRLPHQRHPGGGQPGVDGRTGLNSARTEVTRFSSFLLSAAATRCSGCRRRRPRT